MNLNISKNIKELYARFQDDESRGIFQERLLFYLDGDKSHIYNMIALSETALRRPDGKPLILKLRHQATNRPIVLYGTGGLSSHALSLARKLGVDVLCFADSDPEKQACTHLALPVISPEELIRKYSHCNLAVSNLRYESEIAQNLINMGFPEGQIYYFPLWNAPVYFDQPFFHPYDREIYVDAGCYDGENVKDFFAFSGESCLKAYAMEPDPDNMERSKHMLSDLPQDKLEYVQKGAWSKTTRLFFTNSGDEASAIDDTGEIQIDVVSIDEMVGGDAVTMIKMDIEGAELEALRGAEKTIRTHKPRLAISVYHKPEDILTLPLYIQSLVPEYQFYIRHYTFDWADTVLYAMPQG